MRVTRRRRLHDDSDQPKAITSTSDAQRKTKRRKSSRIEATLKGSSRFFFNLPAELIDIIFAYCDRSDLCSLCQVSRGFYSLTVPILYRSFKPLQWTDVIDLGQRIERGGSISGVDQDAINEAMLSEMRSISLSFKKSFYKHVFRYPDERTFTWMAQKTLENLVSIIKRTKKLQ